MTPSREAMEKARELLEPYRVKRIPEALLTRPADRTWNEWAAAIDQNNTRLDFMEQQFALALDSAREQAIEECAKVAETFFTGTQLREKWLSKDIAQAIRALARKEKP